MKTKKEMKQEYKLFKSKKGVYQIKNNSNGKIFVGSSKDLVAIWNRHKLQLNFGSHQNIELQNDWKKFGEDSFSYEILSEIKEEDGKEIDYNKELKFLEDLYLEELEPFEEKGYNKRKNKT
jgi:group I intron endonuclease